MHGDGVSWNVEILCVSGGLVAMRRYVLTAVVFVKTE